MTRAALILCLVLLAACKPDNYTIVLPEYMKDDTCKNQYNTTTGKIDGWAIFHPGSPSIYISGDGSCGEFFISYFGNSKDQPR